MPYTKIYFDVLSFRKLSLKNCICLNLVSIILRYSKFKLCSSIQKIMMIKVMLLIKVMLMMIVFNADMPIFCSYLFLMQTCLFGCILPLWLESGDTNSSVQIGGQSSSLPYRLCTQAMATKVISKRYSQPRWQH